MSLSTFRTKSSWWTFNDESMTFVRTPVEADTPHRTVSYSSVAQPFLFAIQRYDGRLFVQFGHQYHQYLISGPPFHRNDVFEEIPAQPAVTG